MSRAQDAAKRLSILNPYKVPRVWRLPIANLCRRVGLIAFGLKILSPVIYAEFNRKASQPTVKEVAEYAVLLLRSGSVIESLLTLERVNGNEVPEAMLYRAFAHFARWEYPEAIPSLEAYLKSDLTPYASMVGRVNLAAALVATRNYGRAETLLNQNIEDARAMGATRLLGNNLELRSQIFIDHGEYQRARGDLHEAEALLRNDPSMSRSFVEKWFAVIDGLEGRGSERLRKFRAESKARGEWENVREADLFLSKIAFTAEVFEHLYFGSPFPYYRQMIEHYVGRRPTSLEYVLGDQHASNVINISTGKIEEQDQAIPGKNMHRMVACLVKDFYRPRSLGGLFSEVFSGDHFNIFHSPDRVHQLLRRTRIWLKQEGLPLEIVEDRGHYSLKIIGPVAFRMALEVRAQLNEEVLFQEVQAVFMNQGSFTAREAREKLGLAKTSFNRIIQWAVSEGHLRSKGTSSKTMYEFVHLPDRLKSSA